MSIIFGWPMLPVWDQLPPPPQYGKKGQVQILLMLFTFWVFLFSKDITYFSLYQTHLMYQW